MVGRRAVLGLSLCAAAAPPAAVVAATTCGAAGAACGAAAADDAVSALQSMRGHPPQGHQAEPASDSDDVHIVFTVDCTPYNLWQAELFFFSAQRVGQKGPVTEIISDCTPESRRHVEERHKTLGLPTNYKPFFVGDLNDRRSHCINKPYGVAAWIKEAGAERDVVAVVDPDYLMLRPLSATIDGAQTAFGWPQGAFASVPQRVQKGVVVAQRWGIFMNPTESKLPWLVPMQQNPENMTEAELFTWICSGSRTGKSGCTGVTKHEVGLYHATGVPYIAHKDDWNEWLADDWKDITERLHTVYNGYIVDMLSWAFANIHHQQRELVVHNLQFYHPGHYEPWSAVDQLSVDPCTAPMDEVLADPGLAYFVHYTHYADAWNKRWFESNKTGPSVFERCDATADDKGLSLLLTTQVDGPKYTDPADPKAKGWKFMHCITRRMFAGAIKRTCAGRPAAALMNEVAAGFSF